MVLQIDLSSKLDYSKLNIIYIFNIMNLSLLTCYTDKDMLDININTDKELVILKMQVIEL